jgi:hypothetical protein
LLLEETETFTKALDALEFLKVEEHDSNFLLAENQVNELAEVYFAAKKDLLCAKIVLLRW